MKYRHPHIFSAFVSMSKMLLLLLLPLIRGLLTSLGGGFQAWLQSAWIDILVVCFILVFGFLGWWCSGFLVQENHLVIRNGIFLKKVRSVPLEQISWGSITNAWYLRPFGAVRFRADTLGGSSRESDFSMLLRRKDARQLFSLLGKNTVILPEEQKAYHPRDIYVVLLSAITSNSLAGILLAAAGISQIGDLLGKEFSERIYGTLEQLARLAAFGIPPAAAALGYLLIGGWLLAFASNLIRLKNLSVIRKGQRLHIQSGLFTLREYELDLRQINYLDIRQSAMTKLLKIESVYLYTAGYDKTREDVSVLVPAAFEKNNHKTLQHLLPEMLPSPRSIRPNPGAIFKFLIDALWCCILIPAASWLLCRLVPDWSQVIHYVGGIAMIPAIWFLIVRILDYMTSGLSRDGDTFTLRYSNLFYLHTIVLPRDRIVRVCFRQSILQWWDQKCDVIIYSRCEGQKKHHLRNLSLEECALLFGLPGYIPKKHRQKKNKPL